MFSFWPELLYPLVGPPIKGKFIFLSTINCSVHSQRHARSICLSNSRSNLRSISAKAASVEGKFLIP